MLKAKISSSFGALLAASVIFSPNFASAADVYDARNDALADPAPQGTSVNWSGVYVGGRIGVGNANHDLTAEAYDNEGGQPGLITGFDNNAPVIDPNAETFDVLGLNGVNSLGIIGGGQLGADRQFGNFVAGIFGSYDISNMETEFTFFGETEVIASKDHEWSAGARIGYLVNPETLLYGLAAYTETKYDLGEDDSHTFDGVTAGVGIEFAATSNVFLGLEATHTFYGEETLADDPEGYLGGTDGLRVLDDLDETKIMGTLKIKLNSF